MCQPVFEFDGISRLGADAHHVHRMQDAHRMLAATLASYWQTCEYNAGHCKAFCKTPKLCAGSPHHPAVVEGLVDADGPVKSLQESYTPTSSCFGCGPQAHAGLHLQSYRDEDGVLAEMELSDDFCCFPGVISGGVVSTLLDCHGNWAAAVR